MNRQENSLASKLIKLNTIKLQIKNTVKDYGIF